MTFKQSILIYLLTLVIFFLIDMIWIGVVAKRFYRKHLGPLMSGKVIWPAAILFYLLFIAGLLVFVIRPGVQGGGSLKALFLGGLFGLVAYSTYDLTNLATLKNWPIAVTIVDLVWGTVLGGVVSWLSVLAARKLLKL